MNRVRRWIVGLAAVMGLTGCGQAAPFPSYVPIYPDTNDFIFHGDRVLKLRNPIPLGTNIVLNPTMGFLPVKAGTNRFEDSGVYMTSSNDVALTKGLFVPGALRLFGTNLSVIVNGTNTVETLDKSMIYLLNLAASNAVVRLAPGNGPGQLLALFNVSTNNGFTLYDGDALVGDTNKNVYLRGDWTPADAGDSLLLWGVEGGWAEIGRQSVSTNGSGGTVQGTGTAGRLAAWLTPTTLTNSPIYMVGETNVGLDGQLVLGPGTTNVLSRSGIDLVYTNGSTSIYPGIQVVDGLGKRAKVSVGGNLAVVTGEAGVGLRDNFTTSREVRWFVGKLFPMQTNSFLGADLGNTAYPWEQIHAVQNYIYGLRDPASASNYSRLKLSHTVTNIIFNSQSDNPGRPAGDLLVQSNGTTVARIAMNSGYTGSGSNFFSDDGTFKRVSGGITTNVSTIGYGYVDFAAAASDYILTDDYADVVFDATPMQTSTLAAGTYLITVSCQFNQYRAGGQQAHLKLYNSETTADVPNSERFAGPQNATSFQADWMMTYQSKVVISSSGVIKVMAKNEIAGDSNSFVRKNMATISWIKVL